MVIYSSFTYLKMVIFSIVSLEKIYKSPCQTPQSALLLPEGPGDHVVPPSTIVYA